MDGDEWLVSSRNHFRRRGKGKMPSPARSGIPVVHVAASSPESRIVIVVMKKWEMSKKYELCNSMRIAHNFSHKRIEDNFRHHSHDTWPYRITRRLRVSQNGTIFSHSHIVFCHFQVFERVMSLQLSMWWRHQVVPQWSLTAIKPCNQIFNTVCLLSLFQMSVMCISLGSRFVTLQCVIH